MIDTFAKDFLKFRASFEINDGGIPLFHRRHRLTRAHGWRIHFLQVLAFLFCRLTSVYDAFLEYLSGVFLNLSRSALEQK